MLIAGVAQSVRIVMQYTVYYTITAVACGRIGIGSFLSMCLEAQENLESLMKRIYILHGPSTIRSEVNARTIIILSSELQVTLAVVRCEIRYPTLIDTGQN